MYSMTRACALSATAMATTGLLSGTDRLAIGRKAAESRSIFAFGRRDSAQSAVGSALADYKRAAAVGWVTAGKMRPVLSWRVAAKSGDHDCTGLSDR